MSSEIARGGVADGTVTRCYTRDKRPNYGNEKIFLSYYTHTFVEDTSSHRLFPSKIEPKCLLVHAYGTIEARLLAPHAAIR